MEYQYVVLSNRLTPFNDEYTNNIIDADVKKQSNMFSCNLSKNINIKPFSEVRVCFFHKSLPTAINDKVSLGIIAPNLPIVSTNIGNPYSNRLVKLVGFVNSSSNPTIEDLWVACDNTSTETLTSIDLQIIRLADGRRPEDQNPLPGTPSDGFLLPPNITVGLQFRVNPHKKQLAIAYENNELLRGHLSAFKPNLVNKNDPFYVSRREITSNK